MTGCTSSHFDVANEFDCGKTILPITCVLLLLHLKIEFPGFNLIPTSLLRAPSLPMYFGTDVIIIAFGTAIF